MISGREFVAYNYGALCTLQSMPSQLKSVALESIAREANMTIEELDVFVKEIQKTIEFSSQKKMKDIETMMKTGKMPKEVKDEDLV